MIAASQVRVQQEPLSHHFTIRSCQQEAAQHLDVNKRQPVTAPTWQRGDELVDVLYVPPAGVAGQEAVGQQGQLRASLGGRQGGRGSFVARQV